MAENAVTTSLSIGEPSDTASTEAFAFWYPNWSVWKFRRTLAYWISVLYLEGAVLFIIGAIFEVLTFKKHSAQYEHALVSGPNCMGSVLFSAGSYLGLLQMINLPSALGDKMLFVLTKRRWRTIRTMISWKSFVAYVLYTVGSSFLAVNTCAGLARLTPLLIKLFVRLPGLFSCVSFTSGSLLNCQNNKVWLLQMHTSIWWLCMVYLCGSIHYFLANVVLIVGAATSIANYGFMVGACSFAFASLISLWMWKSEQFGLFVPELNLGERTAEPSEFELSMQAQYGCGRSSLWQFPWLLMYVINAGTAVLNSFLVHTVNSGSVGIAVFHKLVDSAVHFALAHGVLMLASVVHHVPTKRPHSWLLIFMRIVLFFFTANSIIGVGLGIGELE